MPTGTVFYGSMQDDTFKNVITINIKAVRRIRFENRDFGWCVCVCVCVCVLRSDGGGYIEEYIETDYRGFPSSLKGAVVSFRGHVNNGLNTTELGSTQFQVFYNG